MSDWSETTLGELCKFQAGDAFSKDQQGLAVGDYPFIKVSDMNILGNERFIQRSNNWIKESDVSKYRLHQPGAIAFAKIGEALRANRRRVISRETIIDNNMMSATPRGGIEPSFLLYLLESIDFNHVSRGSALPYLTVGDLNKLPVLVPKTEIQKAIGQTLCALDDKIELNRRMNETLEAMAQAIFRDWFVDFGPVRRKLEGASDPVAIMGGLMPDPARAAELAGLFPGEFGEDELPVGWSASTVGDTFNLTMGQSPPGETYNDTGDGLPFFQGRTDFGFRFPERRKFCSQPTRIANPDDTLISVRAPVGDLNMAWEECCIGRGVAAARHQAGGKTYTYYAMRHLQPELEQFESEGTVFGAINKKQFEQLPIVDPDARLVHAFEAVAGALDDRLRIAVTENRTLAETRDYLLPRLMSGEVRVGDVQPEVAA